MLCPNAKIGDEKNRLMNILLTGAFGNLGRSTLAELVKRPVHIRCFELPTPRNQAIARSFGDKIEVIWGI